MSDQITCVHLLMGEQMGQALSLARSSANPGDWLVLVDWPGEGSDAAFIEKLQALEPAILVRQAVSADRPYPDLVGDAELAEALCRATRVLSWW